MFKILCGCKAQHPSLSANLAAHLAPLGVRPSRIHTPLNHGTQPLGAGIGLSTVDPLRYNPPDASTVGMGAGIWWAISSMAALFAGGWVAGHLAGGRWVGGAGWRRHHRQDG